MQSFRYKLFILSALSFLLFFSLATWQAFFNLYFESAGYSGSQIGILGGILQAAIFFSSPFWGIAGDHFGIKKAASISIIGSSALLFFMPYIAGFAAILIYTVVLSAFIQPLASLIDSLIIVFVKKEIKVSYGQLRLWGSLGWAISSYFMGWILTFADIEIIFTAAAFFTFLMFVLLMFYKNDSGNAVKSRISLNHFSFVFKNKRLMLFYILLTFSGICLSPVYLFINLYFKESGGNFDIVGAAFSLMALCEIPLFFFGSRIVKKFGAVNSVMLSILITSLRLFLYWIIQDPLAAVFLGLLHGLTFTLFFVASVEYVHKIIPDNLLATGQSLIWAAHYGIGVTLGNIIIGNVYDTISVRTVMLYDAAFAVLIFILFYVFKKRFPDTSA